MMIRNLSRHEFNSDQIAAMRLAMQDILDLAMQDILDTDDVAFGEPENTFFEDADHFASEISGDITSATAPGEIFLELWARTPLGPQGEVDMHLVKPGTMIIKWVADEHARSLGYFAVRGIKIYQWREISFVANHVGEPDAWGSAVLPRVVYEEAVKPKVMNDFRSGEEFAYIPF